MYKSNFKINWSVYKNWKLWVSLPFMLTVLIPLLLLKAISITLAKTSDLLELALNAETPEWVKLWEEWLANK